MFVYFSKKIGTLFVNATALTYFCSLFCMIFVSFIVFAVSDFPFGGEEWKSKTKTKRQTKQRKKENKTTRCKQETT